MTAAVTPELREEIEQALAEAARPEWPADLCAVLFPAGNHCHRRAAPPSPRAICDECARVGRLRLCASCISILRERGLRHANCPGTWWSYPEPEPKSRRFLRRKGRKS